MASYVLEIVVYGLGVDAQNRSHWAFGIRPMNSKRGILLHVSLIDLKRLIYQFDERSGVEIRSKSPEGSFEVTNLTKEQVRQATKIIREEPAPRDGVERCQDWVLRTIISLKAEELVPPGTSMWIETLVGQAAITVAQTTGSRWIQTSAQ